MKETIIFSTKIKAPVEEVFTYFCKEEAFERLSPSFEKIHLQKVDPITKSGATVAFLTKISFLWIRWICKITKFKKNELFVDSQTSGPFKFWEHKHRFTKIDNNTTELIDEITYTALKLPFSYSFTRKKLRRLFAYRYRVIKEDIHQLSKLKRERKRILIAGGSGFVGKFTSLYLKLCGHEVYFLVRKKTEKPNEIFWDVSTKTIQKEKLIKFDALINFAGENIFGIWTKRKKSKILDSRIQTTQFLVDVFSEPSLTPKVFICASADGYYGINKNHSCDESEMVGDDFLSSVCLKWEATANQLTTARVVNARFSPIFHPQFGMLKTLLPPFKCFLGANIGSGKQMNSWIYVDDVAYQIANIIENPLIEGPVNFCTEDAITNKELSKAIAKALHRPLLFRIPKFLLLLLIPEMAKSLLLANKKILPTKLIEDGTDFSYPKLDDALSHMLGKDSIDEISLQRL